MQALWSELDKKEVKVVLNLETVEDYLNKIPLIRSQKRNPLAENLPDIVPYPDWFDVVLIERDYQVISYYDINPTAEGLEKLRNLACL